MEHAFYELWQFWLGIGLGAVAGIVFLTGVAVAALALDRWVRDRDR